METLFMFVINTMKDIFLLLFLLLIGFSLVGQNPKKTNPKAFLKPIHTIAVENKSHPKSSLFWEIGISANAYNGDLGNPYSKWSASFQTAIRFNRKKRLNGKLAFSFGNFTGENLQIGIQAASERMPNTFFKAQTLSLHYELHYNIIKNSRWIVFVSQGFGLVNFQVKNETGENLQDLRITRAEGEEYGNNSLFLPTGLGAIYVLKNGYGIGTEIQLLNLQTDYLDNISQLGQAGNDNGLWLKLWLAIPLKKAPLKLIPPQNRPGSR